MAEETDKKLSMSLDELIKKRRGSGLAKRYWSAAWASSAKCNLLTAMQHTCPCPWFMAQGPRIVYTVLIGLTRNCVIGMTRGILQQMLLILSLIPMP